LLSAHAQPTSVVAVGSGPAEPALATVLLRHLLPRAWALASRGTRRVHGPLEPAPLLIQPSLPSPRPLALALTLAPTSTELSKGLAKEQR
jgi:hypothetical protein